MPPPIQAGEAALPQQSPVRLIGKLFSTLAIGLIRGYQLVLSPALHALMGPSFGCRFHPTCSQYAIDCFRNLPLHRACYHSLRRISRCHPWGGSGHDPAPEDQRSR